MDINFIPHPLQGTPYGQALDLAIVFAIACWLLSVITREYSWVDRIWSICPAIYCLIVAADSDFSSTRLNAMSLLVVAWGVRLTFNSRAEAVTGPAVKTTAGKSCRKDWARSNFNSSISPSSHPDRCS